MRNAASGLLFCLFTAAFAHPQEQRPAVRAGISGVLIDVTVLDKDDRPVTDLTGSDFDLAEDGKPQQIVSATLMRGGVPARDTSRQPDSGGYPTDLQESRSSREQEVEGRPDD